MMTSYLCHRCAPRTYYAYLPPPLPPFELRESAKATKAEKKLPAASEGENRCLSAVPEFDPSGKEEKGTRYEKLRGVCVFPPPLSSTGGPCRFVVRVRTLSSPPPSSVFIAAAECRL